MKYQVRNVPYLSEENMLRHLKNGAGLYLEYADTDLLFIYRQSKECPYEFYEIYFGKRNFMHLAGIKSSTIKAKDFAEACALEKVKLQDCMPVHSISNMYSKISILEQLLNFRYSKCYKIGKKGFSHQR